MKRNSQRGRHDETQGQSPSTGLNELEGLVEMGMKREALRMARDGLKSPAITATAFNGAVNAILTLADKCKPWATLVEAAYARLPKRDQSAVRFFMLSFHYCNHDYEAASRLIPRRFAGDFGLLELVFAMEVLLALGRLEEMERLVRKIPYALKVAENSTTQAQLLSCWAEYLARTGDWEQAIKLWDVAQLDETLSRNAVSCIVEMHVARALRAIRFGFQLVAQFKKNFDPQAETILPGNDEAIQQQAEKEFRRLQKILEKVVPKKRQKELGLTPSSEPAS